jgi:hypothetical protein
MEERQGKRETEETGGKEDEGGGKGPRTEK